MTLRGPGGTDEGPYSIYVPYNPHITLLSPANRPVGQNMIIFELTAASIMSNVMGPSSEAVVDDVIGIGMICAFKPAQSLDWIPYGFHKH